MTRPVAFSSAFDQRIMGLDVAPRLCLLLSRKSALCRRLCGGCRPARPLPQGKRGPFSVRVPEMSPTAHPRGTPMNMRMEAASGADDVCRRRQGAGSAPTSPDCVLENHGSVDQTLDSMAKETAPRGLSRPAGRPPRHCSVVSRVTGDPAVTAPTPNPYRSDPAGG